MIQTDCRFINVNGTDCKALNKLYCAKEKKPCAFYKPREKENLKINNIEKGGK